MKVISLYTRVAQIVGMWAWHAEKVEEERENGRERVLLRIVKVRSFLSRNVKIRYFLSGTLKYGTFCRKTLQYALRENYSK